MSAIPSLDKGRHGFAGPQRAPKGVMARPHPAGGLSPGKGENAASAPFGVLWGVFALVKRRYSLMM